ncbi:patatin-like phospholipase-like protein [Diplogelasinospora grovesii]|uniref:Patatin-like phospholipase-like protein n=1 Tax=Diplogelasinospora grovesii TaxID=303347 RepID=A0AAN6S337_9PEZI|nr:patatin-like phospholipase-like protein [Diplogelasinospora grovesii]
MACKHTEWLCLSGQGSSSLVRQTGRLRSLVRSLPSPSTQTPTLVLLLESRNGRILTADEPCTSATSPGTIHLCLDSETLSQNNPVLVASSFPVQSRRRIALRKGYKCCSTLRRHTLSGSPDNTESLIHSQVLLPFVDVFCFIYHDTSDLDYIVYCLNGWVEARKSSAIQCVLPEMLILLTEEGVRKAQASKQLLTNLAPNIVQEYCLRFTKIKKDELNSPNGRSCLRRHLRKASDRMRHRRADRSLLFSASHFMAFSEIAFDHLVLTETFDFLKASRLRNPVAADLAQHLTNFVNQVQSAQELTTFAAETIASSFLLDHFHPPGMHAFKSSEVFHALYRDTCAYVACLTVQPDRPDGHLLPSAFVSLILKTMNSPHKEYLSGRSAAEIHLATLQKYASSWAELRSEKTCFVCIRRTDDDPWLFRINACFLCRVESQVAVPVHPPTAGIGILCIDGGGVRGIIPTTVLELLEERIGLPILIQEHFKLAFGISAGFQSGPLAGIPLFSAVVKLVVALFNDGMYRAKHLERVLRETYGSDTKMLDPSYATTIGAKIGLPAATVCEPSTILFTNYNGIGEGAVRIGYDVHQGAEDANVWEVARGCTAAPAYFKPKYIEGVGPLQDAGVLQNNPLTIALSELHAVYPGVSAPQFLINLGTGTVRSPDGPQEKPTGIFANSFIMRLFRSYMSLIRGRRTWEDFRRSIKKSSVTDRFFRLDITFEGPEPKLDDVKAIPELKDMVRANEALSQAIDEISRCITASLFYFELESIPENRNGEFSGVGHIFCFRRKSDPALEALIDKLSRSSARFIINGVEIPGDITDPSFRDENGNFRKIIAFKTRGEIAISLREGRCQAYPISGAPFSVERLVAAQGLKKEGTCTEEVCRRTKRRRSVRGRS